MPTLLGHVAAGAALGTIFENPQWPRRAYLVGAICAVLPDLDVLGFRLGVPYGSTFGHRGLSHSLFAAALLGILAMALGFSRKDWRAPLAFYLMLATVSHGLLDAVTSGGMGVGFFAPFDHARYFFPWRPIRVSPLALRRILTPHFWIVLSSELRWIVAPAAVFSGLMLMVKRRASGSAS